MATQAEIEARLLETYERYEEAERNGDTEMMEQIRSYGDELRAMTPSEAAPTQGAQAAPRPSRRPPAPSSPQVDPNQAPPGAAPALQEQPAPPEAEGGLSWSESVAKPFRAGLERFTAGVAETGADVISQFQHPATRYMDDEQKQTYNNVVTQRMRAGLKGPEIDRGEIAKRILTPTQRARMWADRMESAEALPWRGTAAELRKRAKENMPSGIEEKDLLESPEVFVPRAVETIGRMSPALLTRKPVAGSTMIAADVYGSEMQQGMEEMGLNEEQARQRAATMAMTELITEKIPLDYIFKRTDGGGLTGVGKNLLKAAGAEGIQESLVEAIQMGYDVGLLDEEVDAREALIRIRDAFILGGTAGATVRVPFEVADATVAGSQKRQGERRQAADDAAKQAQEDAEGVSAQIDATFTGDAATMNSVLQDLETTADGEYIEPERQQRLVELGWAKRRGEDEIVILPAGKRARGELAQRVSDAKAEAYPGPDRRKDNAQREAYNRMTEEERYEALMVDEMTGLGSKRAFYENFENNPERPAMASFIDADGLGWVNDSMEGGHAIGDQYLQLVGEAINSAGLDGYHISGDEFVVTGESEAELQTAMDAINAELAEQVLSDGKMAFTPSVSFGIAADKDRADALMIEQKKQRRAEGTLAEKGKTPIGAKALTREAEQTLAERFATEQDMAQQDTEGLGPPQEPPPVSPEQEEVLLERADQLALMSEPTQDLDVRTDELLTAIAKVGGIDREAALAEGMDLADLQQNAPKGAFKASDAKYQDFDMLREKLAEEGYVGDEINELLDKINESLRGTPQYSTGVDFDVIGPEWASVLRGRAEIQERAITPRAAGRAIAKFLEGEKLGAREQRFIEDMMADIDEARMIEMAEADPLATYEALPSEIQAAAQEYFAELEQGATIEEIEARIDQEEAADAEAETETADEVAEAPSPDRGERAEEEGADAVPEPGPEPEPLTAEQLQQLRDLEVRGRGPVEGAVTKQGTIPDDRGMQSAGGLTVLGKRKKGQRITDDEMTFEYPGGFEVTVPLRERDEGAAKEMADRVFQRDVLLEVPRFGQRAWRARRSMEQQAERRETPEVEEDRSPYSVNRTWTPGSSRVSTRVPWNVRSDEDPMVRDLTVGIDAARLDQRAFDRNADHLRTYAHIRIPEGANSEAVFEAVVSHLSGNLTWLYGQIPANWRGRAQRWYEGAHKLSGRLAGRFGYTRQAGAGVLAALSPQKDWRENVSLAERVMDIWTTQQNTRVTPAMRRLAETLFPAGMQGNAEVVLRSRLQQLTDPVQQAMWIRLYDQAMNPQTYRDISPEGMLLGTVTNQDGRPATLRWNNFQTVAKAVKILQDPSNENISKVLGSGHKIRSFYNNIATPDSVRGDVTIDTHAVAAAQLMPVGASHPMVDQNFGSSRGVSDSGDTGLQGLYWVYAEAYRRAADELGIMPRQLQSAVWEGARGMFPDTFKTEPNMAASEEIWQNYQSEAIEADAAREQISEQANGITDPSWVGSTPRPYAGAPASTYAPDVREPGVAEPGPDEGAPDRGGEGDLADRGEAGPGVAEPGEIELAELRYDVDEFATRLKEELGEEFLSTLEMSVSNQGDLSLDMLIVPQAARKAGTGTYVMNKIVEFADQNGLRATLIPAEKSDAIGTTSRGRLVRFYKRFGFVENKGRNQDFTLGGITTGTVMYRNAEVQPELDLGEIETSKQIQAAMIERLTENVQTDTIESTVNTVDSAEDAVAIMQPIAERAQENMMALVLDANWRPLQIIKHSVGLHDRAMVNPHHLIGSILDVPGAANVYFAHNHPSDIADPSRADMQLTTALRDAMYDTQNWGGTGINPVGMLVLTPSGKTATIFQDGRTDQLDPAAAAEAREELTTPRQVPVTERTITRIPDYDLPQITGEQSARAWLKRNRPDESGILYLDTRHNVVGYLPMTQDQMLNPAADSAAGSAIVRTLHQTNAAAVIVHDVSDSNMGGRMTGGFINRIPGAQTQLLDIMYGPTQRSTAAQGIDMNTISGGGPQGPGRAGPREVREDDEYDNPYLTSASKKIGPEAPKQTFLQRWNDYYTQFKREWQQGFFDKFYGIRKALMDAGEVMDGYIEARFSTNLDSVMRAIMEFGAPAWEDGMVTTVGGQGLADILAPIGDRVKEWSMYMAGVRAKRLLMDGYNQLESEALRQEVNTWLRGNGYAADSDGAFDAMADEAMPPELAEAITAAGRERNFSAPEIRAMSELVEENPDFRDVAEQYAEFNRQVLNFAEQAGIIDPSTRPFWEHADYVPFYRIQDDRMVGPIRGPKGIEGQRDPTRYLKGQEAPIGNVVDNILANITNLVNASMKNQAARTTVDALKGTGIISKVPLAISSSLIPMGQVKKILVNAGIDPEVIPPDALRGLRMMTSMEPPTNNPRREGGEGGAISIMRDGKREYYHTEDELLFRAMSSIEMQRFGKLTQAFRNFKRFFTGTITLDPAFMMRNYARDLLSSYVLDRTQPPGVWGAVKATAGLPMHMVRSVEGFGQAMAESESYRNMMSAGAAFDSGYINYGDPASAGRAIRKAMRSKGFRDSMLDTPAKLLEAWKALGSGVENANRIAVYNAAIRAGKSKKQAAYEAKDLMDFSMGGDYPVIQWLIQTVPFMGARLQGLHRLGRGAYENPAAFTMKGLLLMSAGMALWFAYRDDERYQELEEWDKDTYYHWWIGDKHFRLPKPFEIGAIFNTIPERFAELALSEEPDAGKLYLKRMWHMVGETFAMNPIPQPLQPVAEDIANFNFFTQRELVSAFEEKRLPAEQYRYYTSPTFREMAEASPRWMQEAFPRMTSPMVLENYWRGWTGTMGQYAMMGADAVMREAADYPAPPAWGLEDYPVVSAFYRGDQNRRTKYSEEFYTLLRRTLAVQESMRFLDKEQRKDRERFLRQEYREEIRISKRLENYREQVSDINRRIRRIYQRPTDEGQTGYMSPDEKRTKIRELEQRKNAIFKRGYELRPAAKAVIPIEEQGDLTFLLEEFGQDDDVELLANQLNEGAPMTADLVRQIMGMSEKDRKRLAQMAPASKDARPAQAAAEVPALETQGGGE